MTEPDPRLDTILAAIQQLTTVVGALAQHVAAQPDTAAGASGVVNPIVFTKDDGYAPLVPMDDDNCARRTRLAADLGILGTEPGAELVRHGARGFYRNLLREDEQARLEFRREHARALVEDALSEDPKEAADMGADLLKFWEEEDEDVFMARGGVDVEAKLPSGGGS